MTPLTPEQQDALLDLWSKLFWLDAVTVLILWECGFRDVVKWPLLKSWQWFSSTRFGVRFDRWHTLQILRIVRRDKKIMGQIRQRWRDKKRRFA